jgi:hypothetical protein
MTDVYTDKIGFEDIYELDVAKTDSYPVIRHSKMSGIEGWDALETKKIQGKRSGSSQGRIPVEKITEKEEFFGKRMLLKIRSSAVVDVMKFGNDYYVYRVGSSVADGRSDRMEINNPVEGDMLQSASVSSKI